MQQWGSNNELIPEQMDIMWTPDKAADTAPLNLGHLGLGIDKKKYIFTYTMWPGVIWN